MPPRKMIQTLVVEAPVFKYRLQLPPVPKGYTPKLAISTVRGKTYLDVTLQQQRPDDATPATSPKPSKPRRSRSASAGSSAPEPVAATPEPTAKRAKSKDAEKIFDCDHCRKPTLLEDKHERGENSYCPDCARNLSLFSDPAPV